MAAHVESRIGVRQLYSVVERGSIGHQRRRSQDPVAVRLDDAFVHIGGESEIIRVDEQPSQNIPSLMRRNFFGLARMSLRRLCASRVAPLSES